MKLYYEYHLDIFRKKFKIIYIYIYKRKKAYNIIKIYL